MYQTVIITIDDKKYPNYLRQIKNPPKALYVRGKPEKDIFGKTLAIVGSRRMSRYGREVVGRLIPDIVDQGITTISGFMYGIDTEVHEKTVEVGGVTVAVFGCGLDVIYPPENKKLYERIIESGGLVVSEYEPDAKPHLWKFPQRNRIVVGLSTLGVLVVEGKKKSGSMVTANIAVKEKRALYAVPGPISSKMSEGPNQLLKDGLAQMVLSSFDITTKRTKKGHEKKTNNLSGIDLKIYEALQQENSTIDEIAYAIGFSSVEVSSAMSILSLKGLVKEEGGKYSIV